MEGGGLLDLERGGLNKHLTPKGGGGLLESSSDQLLASSIGVKLLNCGQVLTFVAFNRTFDRWRFTVPGARQRVISHRAGSCFN